MIHTIAARTPQRTYILPSPALRTVISHYTLYTPLKAYRNPGAVPAAGNINIVPDASGCIVCVVHATHLELRYWGPTSQLVTVATGGAVPGRMVFVEFLPGGAQRLLHVPMRQWQDSIAPLDCADIELSAMISEAYCRCSGQNCWVDYEPFLHQLDAIFLSRLAVGRSAPLAEHILSGIAVSQGRARINEFAQATGYSGRHINRVVSEVTGLSVKLLSRIVRINNACQFLSVADQSLTALAQHLDYHDQAHFIHDFQAVCGVTPGKYRESMSTFYNEQLKLSGIIPEQ